MASTISRLGGGELGNRDNHQLPAKPSGSGCQELGSTTVPTAILAAWVLLETSLRGDQASVRMSSTFAASQAPLLFQSCPAGFREGLGRHQPRSQALAPLSETSIGCTDRSLSGGKRMGCEKQAEVSNFALP